jgi:RNA polymerase sigma factor (sigma-70 family)
VATLKRIYATTILADDDWEDIFQDSCIILMEGVKNGKFEQRPGSMLFSYFVEIGKKNMQNALRKHNKHHPIVQKDGSTHILVFNPKEQHTSFDEIDREVTAEEKQAAQDEFIDKVFDSVPTECKNIFKMFYWEHKPMDEIASIYGLRNANSAKTKKTRCMKLFKDVKEALLKSGDYDEELIKAAAERASLRELLEDERAYCQLENVAIAALKNEDEEKPDNDKE